MTWMLPLAVLVPVLGAALIAALRHHARAAGAAALLTPVVLAGLNIHLYRQLVAGHTLAFDVFEPVAGVHVSLHGEPLGMLFALVASLLWIPTAVYTAGYARIHGLKRCPAFNAWFALALGAAMGVAYSANLLTLFIFYELLTLVTYPLVTHEGTPEARQAGRRYLIYLLGTSMAFLLLAIVCTWLWSGGDLTFIQGGIAGALPAALFPLFAFGAGKAALVPLHRWLPGAMVAPAPVSALLHAVAVVKAGVFVILKVSLYVFHPQQLAGSGGALVVMYAAVATVFIASVVALRSDNLKERLAYSTIAQLACIVIGAALASATGFLGGGLHLLTHACGKITLFFCAGVITAVTHCYRVSELNGIGRAMPWTLGAFLVAAVSVIGLPPGGGTWSKWMLVQGSLEAGYYLPVAALAFSTLASILYLLEIPLRAFLLPGSAARAPALGVPLSCRVALVSTTAASVLLFLYPEWGRSLLALAVDA